MTATALRARFRLDFDETGHVRTQGHALPVAIAADLADITALLALASRTLGAIA